MLETSEKRRYGPRIFALVTALLGDAIPTVSRTTGPGFLGSVSILSYVVDRVSGIIDEILRIDANRKEPVTARVKVFIVGSVPHVVLGHL